ncbi:hypothetical protein BDW72DRAFT_186309 [Aspergillus terricola var. indicus]
MLLLSCLGGVASRPHRFVSKEVVTAPFLVFFFANASWPSAGYNRPIVLGMTTNQPGLLKKLRTGRMCLASRVPLGLASLPYPGCSRRACESSNGFGRQYADDRPLRRHWRGRRCQEEKNKKRQHGHFGRAMS